MDQAGVVSFLNERLHLNLPSIVPDKLMYRWKELARRVDTLRREVTIALVGKYTKLEDSYASVSKSLQHASIAAGYKLNLKFIEACNLERTMKQDNPVLYHEAWQSICMSDGILVPGGFGQRGIEGKIRACQWARENKKPFLGICLGLQAAVIEFARNVLDLKVCSIIESLEF
jgi:CTP synthase